MKRVLYAEDDADNMKLEMEPWSSRASACAIEATPPILPMFPSDGLGKIPLCLQAEQLSRRWDELVNT